MTNSIRLTPYESIEYRGSNIYLFKTRNQKFILHTCYCHEIEIATAKNEFFYIYSSKYKFEQNVCPQKKNEQFELLATDFKLTESEAITAAKKNVDREVGDFNFLKENDISTHIYDRETGKVAPRWCPLNASPYELEQSKDGCTVFKVTPYYKWQHEYAINYEGYAPAEEDSIPYVYVNNCLIVNQFRELEGWSIAKPFGRTMALLRELGEKVE